jgi:hypothetical protein
MSKEDKIDILKEVKEQVIHESGLINNMRSLKLVAYANVVEIIEKKIKDIRYTRQFRG